MKATCAFLSLSGGDINVNTMQKVLGLILSWRTLSLLTSADYFKCQQNPNTTLKSMAQGLC